MSRPWAASSPPGTAPGPRLAPAPDGRAGHVLADRYAPRDAKVRRTLELADAAGVLLGLVAVIGPHGSWRSAAWIALTVPLWMLVFRAYGLYDRDVRRLGRPALDELPAIGHAVGLGALLLLAATAAAPVPALDAWLVLAFGAATALCMLALRALARRALVRVLGPVRVLLVGGGPVLALVARTLAAQPGHPCVSAGVLADRATPAPAASPAPVLGGLEELEDVAVRHRIDQLVIAGTLAPGATEALLRRSQEIGLKTTIVPQGFEVLGPAAAVDEIEGVTAVSVHPPMLSRTSRTAKRALDLLVAGVVLVAALPVIAAIIVAVRLDSPGPAFFTQLRVGCRRRPIRLHKFRTMVVGADAMAGQLAAASKDPHWLHLDHDPRVTRVGRFLRLSSLDELPQLWNVLKGEMSLVGPRPLVAAEDGRIPEWAQGRCDLKPGLTGPWQVLGRTRIPFEEMVRLDRAYVTDWSFWRDIQLLLRTVPAVLTRRGAN